MRNLFRKILPPFLKRWIRAIVKTKPQYGWFGDFPTWQEAEKQCSGYSHAAILQKVISATRAVKNGEAKFERDSVLFHEEHYSEPLLSAFRFAAENNQGNLFVVDFGGSLGSTWFQNKRRLLSFSNCKWCVVEQKHFVDAGQSEFTDEYLSFSSDISHAIDQIGRKPHVLFLSSVLQYLEDPFQFIDQALNLEFPFIIIDRTAFIEAPRDIITVQVVPEFVYKASYPAWFFSEKKLKEAFQSRYEFVSEFPSAFDDDGVVNGRRVYRKGFLLQRKP